MANNEAYGIDIMKVMINGYELTKIKIGILKDLIDPELSDEDAFKILSIYFDDSTEKREEGLEELITRYPIFSNHEEIKELGEKFATILQNNKDFIRIFEKVSKNTFKLVEGLLPK